MFDLTLVKQLFCAIIKKRVGFNAQLVWYCTAAGILNFATLEGNGSISYLFSKSALGWDITDFSIFIGINYIITIFGMLLLTKVGGSILSRF